MLAKRDSGKTLITAGADLDFTTEADNQVVDVTEKRDLILQTDKKHTLSLTHTENVYDNDARLKNTSSSMKSVTTDSIPDPASDPNSDDSYMEKIISIGESENTFLVIDGQAMISQSTNLTSNYNYYNRLL